MRLERTSQKRDRVWRFGSREKEKLSPLKENRDWCPLYKSGKDISSYRCKES
jgi:hypothetical protein